MMTDVDGTFSVALGGFDEDPLLRALRQMMRFECWMSGVEAAGERWSKLHVSEGVRLHLSQ